MFSVIVGCDALSDGGEPDLSACARNSECVLAPTSCCGSCGERTPIDVEAINDAASQAHFHMRCEPNEGCPLVACVPSAPMPSYPPEVTAACQAGHCVVRDSRMF